MEKIAFITRGTYIYWSSIILALAVLAAVCFFAAVYLKKGGSVLTLCVMIPVSAVLSLLLSRLIHWYCRADAYESLQAALTDHSWGGYALMGVFIACILTACVLRLLRIEKNLPRLLDCLALAGGAGIAVGRFASVFNTSDRGLILPDSVGFPFASAVANAVSGVVENRLATFMLQSMVTALIVVVLAVYMFRCEKKQKPLREGDICLLFLNAYGASQVIFDSTRYDSLFLRSNGFVSIVQILGAVSLAVAVIIFSVRMVKNGGLKKYHFAIWVALAALLGGAGYMEYYVQRHGDQAAFAYSIMGTCLVGIVAVTVLVRYLAIRQPKTEAETGSDVSTSENGTE